MVRRNELLVNSLRMLSSGSGGKVYIMQQVELPPWNCPHVLTLHFKPHGKQYLNECDIHKQMQYLMGEENGNTIFKLHSRAFAKFSEYSEYQINLVYIVTLLDSCEKQGDTVLFPKHFNTLLDQVRRCLHQILAKHDMVHAFELMGKIRDLWENGDFTNIVPRIYNRDVESKKCSEDKSSAKSYQQSEQQAYLQKKLYEKEREVNQLGFENSELKKQAQEYELRSQQADYDKAQVIFERNVYKQELEQLRGELERREGRLDRKDRMNDESEPK